MNVVGSFCKLLSYKQLTNVPARAYAFKSDLKIKWVRPEKIPCHMPEKSGDLQPMPEVDQTQYALDFKKSKELEDADDLVKRLFTLRFQPRRKTTQVYIRGVVGDVRRHANDKGSIEARIARWTGAIRSLQALTDRFPMNTGLRVNIKELVDKRKKHLKYLRRWDYKKFEWLLESLGLVYKPPVSEFQRVTRKESLRKLTRTYCDDIVSDRLDAYRRQLEEQQPAFLQEKISTLEFLRQEQKDCGVEVTIWQEEIDAAKELLDKILKEKSLREQGDS